MPLASTRTVVLKESFQGQRTRIGTNDGALFAGEVKVEVRFSADCVDSDFIAPHPSTAHCSEVGCAQPQTEARNPGRSEHIPRASGIVKMKDFADHRAFQSRRAAWL